MQTLTPSRVYVNSTTKGAYKTPQWPIVPRESIGRACVPIARNDAAKGRT